jgi:DNA gyrase inhibitor GyrI
MTDNAPELSVCIRDLSAMRVACLSCPAGGDQAEMAPCIRAAFQRVQAFMRGLDHDPYTLLTIGALRMEEGRLATYDCCVQVPADVQAGTSDIAITDLPGGRYAVLSIVKDPAVIGPTIGRFYREYAANQQLVLDPTRPTYEVYYEKTMEYCVPLR